MNLSTKKLNSANAIANGVIATKDLEEKLTKVATRLSKTIKVDGFRKGKVPLNLIKARYKDAIKQDAQKEAVQEMLQEAIKDLKIESKQVIGDPIITKFDEKSEGIDVEIKISLTPEIDLKLVDKCIPSVKFPKIENKAIKERLEEVAKREAPLVEAPKDKKLEKNDFAVFDFEGFIDDKPFDGGKAENFELMIGSNQFIAGFEDSMIGMKAGDNKDIKVTFPKDYQAENLAGKDAVFKIKLHGIKVKDSIKIDDALAKRLLPQKENANLEDLNEQIKNQLEIEAKTKLYNEELKEKLVDNLFDTIKFDLPDLIVEQEMDMLFRNSLGTISPDELKQLQSDANKAKEKRESFRATAQKSVTITFIVDALAKRDGVVVSDNEVFQTIYYEAMMMGQNPKEVVEYYKNNNLLPAIKMAMIEDRVLHKLLDSKIEQSEKVVEEKKESKTKKENKSTKKDSK
ncbi:trigger factor [Helicobacter anseris]|uniref:Trigger factor n=1 Tax=Helicobacter anseris TaxID=375926 RepID=A0A3D8J919_9HELI|nr:trigger factor [Helicobacter anseris]RDU73999.1 trigger factor [Helicobacter anseris]